MRPYVLIFGVSYLSLMWVEYSCNIRANHYVVSQRVWQVAVSPPREQAGTGTCVHVRVHPPTHTQWSAIVVFDLVLHGYVRTPVRCPSPARRTWVLLHWSQKAAPIMGSVHTSTSLYVVVCRVDRAKQPRMRNIKSWTRGISEPASYDLMETDEPALGTSTWG